MPFDDGYYDDNPWGDAASDLRSACRRAIELANGMFGHIFPITSLTTTTVVCDALKMGEPSSKYARWYIVRRGAASSADRIRQVTEFDGTTGTLTHAGANYSDTTFADEYVEICPFSPSEIDQHAQQVLRVCRRYDRDIIPAHGGDTYYLDQYPWIDHRGHVQRLLWNGSPLLGRNGTFDKWNTVSNAGALEPDEWTKTNGTWSRLTTNPFAGPYELSVVRAGTTVTVEQYIGGGGSRRSLLSDGVDSLRGQPFGVMLIARTAVASQGRAFIDDGTTVYSSYHTGGGTHEELTKEITVSATAPYVRFGFVVEVDGAFNVSMCIPYSGELTDAMRRNIYHGSEVQFDWRDRPTAIVPNYRANRGSSYVLESWRPYPALDATRLLAGNADSDTSDIPVDLWAYGILALTFSAHVHENPEHFGPLAAEFNARFQQLRGAHQWDVRPHRFMRRPLGPALRRL